MQDPRVAKISPRTCRCSPQPHTPTPSHRLLERLSRKAIKMMSGTCFRRAHPDVCIDSQHHAGAQLLQPGFSFFWCTHDGNTPQTQHLAQLNDSLAHRAVGGAEHHTVAWLHSIRTTTDISAQDTWFIAVTLHVLRRFPAANLLLKGPRQL